MKDENIATSLKSLDKELDLFKSNLFKRNSLKVNQQDMIMVKSISSKLDDLLSLVSYLSRNQHELSK